ncbi:MAG: hypothetical protein AAB631_01810 [Patescibacteria group bacterium]
MMDNKKNLVFLGLLLGLFLGILFLIKAQFNVGEVAMSVLPPVATSEVSSPIASVALAEFVNIKGERWRIPKGKAEFDSITSADVYPQFVSGVLDPLDVHPGDTQRMRIVINDTAALTEVYAEVGHDKGKDKVPLVLASAGAVSVTDQFDQPVFFDEKGVLVAKEEWMAKHTSEERTSLFETAKAQSLRQYVYEGSWVAHDTHKTTYRTTFFAIDALARKNHLELAWSDPVCTIATTTTPRSLTGPCFLSSVSDVDGIDGFDLDLNAKSITISGGATFAYAPGNNITLLAGGTGAKQAGSAITILKSSGGGNIVKKYVYYDDIDNDRYPPASTLLARYTSSSPIWVGHVRMSAAPVGATLDTRQPVMDCYDSNYNAKPGQTSYFYTQRGDGSFDYDCSGLETKVYNSSSMFNPATIKPTIIAWNPTIPVGGGCHIITADTDTFATCGTSHTVGLSTCTGWVTEKPSLLKQGLATVFNQTLASHTGYSEGWFATTAPLFDCTAQTLTSIRYFCYAPTVYVLCR